MNRGDIIKLVKKIFLVLILIFMFSYKNIKVNASTNYEYTVYFDYELTQKYNLDTNILSSAKNISGIKLDNAEGKVSDLSISIFTDISIHDNVLKNNGYISFTNFTIQVNTNYEEVNISLVDEFNNPIFDSNTKVLDVTELIDQIYYCNIICKDYYAESLNKVFITNILNISFAFTVDTIAPTGSVYDGLNKKLSIKETNTAYVSFKAQDESSGIDKIYYQYKQGEEILYTEGTKLYDNGIYWFYCYDKAGNKSKKYIVYMDHTKPVLILTDALFNSDTNKPFSITVDDDSSYMLFCKKPGEEKYTLVYYGEMAVGSDMDYGTYYYYAIDIYDNKTEEVWINYGGNNPNILIKQVENSNSVFLTWENSQYNVTIDNEKYNKEEVISKEGIHNVEITDINGNISNLSFEISCYYVRSEIVSSTCTSNGYSIWKCITCNNTKIEEEISKSSHNYNSYFLEPNCINCGGVYHYCIYCNENYITDTIPPLGHNLIYEIQNPSCIQEGKRVITCKICDYYKEETIKLIDHNYILIDHYTVNNENYNVYLCEDCYTIYEEKELEKEAIINFTESLENIYFPYMVWIMLMSVGIWSLVIGIRFIFLKQNNEIAFTKNMIKNYILGLIAIFIVIVIIPILINVVTLVL